MILTSQTKLTGLNIRKFVVLGVVSPVGPQVLCTFSFQWGELLVLSQLIPIAAVHCIVVYSDAPPVGKPPTVMD